MPIVSDNEQLQIEYFIFKMSGLKMWSYWRDTILTDELDQGSKSFDSPGRTGGECRSCSCWWSRRRGSWGRRRPWSFVVIFGGFIFILASWRRWLGSSWWLRCRGRRGFGRHWGWSFRISRWRLIKWWRRCFSGCITWLGSSWSSSWPGWLGVASWTWCYILL